MKLKNKKIFTFSTLFLLSIYLLGFIYYNDRFMSNTYINEVEVSDLNVKEASILVNEKSSWEGLSIMYKDELLTNMSADDIDYVYIENKEIYNLADEISSLGWIKSLFVKSEYNVPLEFSYNEEKLREIVGEIKELDNKVTDAKLEYLEESMEFIVTPGIYSIDLDVDELTKIASEEIDLYSNSIDIEEYVIKPSIELNDEDLVATKKKANELLQIELTYKFGEDKELVNHNNIKDWIYSDGSDLAIDEEAVFDYVASNISKYDTYGSNRKFKTTNGQEITTSGGSYGWMTHRTNTTNSLIESIKEGESKEVFPIYSYEAQNRGKDDIGDSYVEIDLTNQKVYVYNLGELIVSSDVVTGNPSRGFETPKSVDPITYKTTNAILTGPGYESPVDYWIPFNGDVGLHDASWQSRFGGNVYKTKGSRGCINLPTNIAEKIYDNVYKGMPVIVY